MTTRTKHHLWEKALPSGGHIQAFAVPRSRRWPEGRLGLYIKQEGGKFVIGGWCPSDRGHQAGEPPVKIVDGRAEVSWEGAPAPWEGAPDEGPELGPIWALESMINQSRGVRTRSEDLAWALLPHGLSREDREAVLEHVGDPSGTPLALLLALSVMAS